MKNREEFTWMALAVCKLQAGYLLVTIRKLIGGCNCIILEDNFFIK